MNVTTSIKLPEQLKATIAKVAMLEGKTAHALMVETLQTAMDDALARQQFYADGELAYQDTLQTNQVYPAQEVKTFILARAQGTKLSTPVAVPLNVGKPISDS